LAAEKSLSAGRQYYDIMTAIDWPRVWFSLVVQLILIISQAIRDRIIAVVQIYYEYIFSNTLCTIDTKLHR